MSWILNKSLSKQVKENQRPNIENQTHWTKFDMLGTQSTENILKVL